MTGFVKVVVTDEEFDEEDKRQNNKACNKTDKGDNDFVKFCVDRKRIESLYQVHISDFIELYFIFRLFLI